MFGGKMYIPAQHEIDSIDSTGGFSIWSLLFGWLSGTKAS
jgi:hypothetical protein